VPVPVPDSVSGSESEEQESEKSDKSDGPLFLDNLVIPSPEDDTVYGNRVNVSATPNDCQFVVFKNEKVVNTVFPVVDTLLGLNRQIKTSCNIAPRTAPYSPMYNQAQFSSPVYKKANEQSVLTTIDYMFTKMKTGVFVRIRNGHVANFQLLYNVKYENDFHDKIRFPNNQSPAEFLKAKKGNPRKWNYNVKEWNATNCLIRNEANDIYPTTGYLSEMYDMLVETCRHRDIPDCVFFLNRKDFPYLNRKGKEAYEALYGEDTDMSERFRNKSFIPILSQSTSSSHADIPIPTGDDWCNICADEQQKEKNRYFADPSSADDGKIKCTNSYVLPDSTTIPAWEDRQPIVFWRGQGTGCGSTVDTNPRLKLTELSASNAIPGLDAGVTNFTRRDKVDPVTHVVTSSKDIPGLAKKNFVDRDKQLAYKFVLNVEGNSAAYRFGSLFRFGYCVLNVESRYKLWFEPFLQDRVHYIRVKHDLSDLAETVAWCLSHDAECKQIAKNGREFYDKYFRRDFVYDYFADILNATSALTKYSAKTPANFVDYNQVKLWVNELRKRSKLSVQPYRLTASVKQGMVDKVAENRSNYIIVVPYRDNAIQNRKQQLDRFLAHYAGSQILVVTQTDKHKFNRGALLNAGFHFLAQQPSVPGDKMRFIFHDVDLLSSREIVDTYYGDDSVSTREIVHYGHLFKDYYDYPNFLGGAISFTKRAYLAINGFPNHFYGWGGEDDALANRIASRFLKVYRPDEPKTGQEMALPADKDTKNVKTMIAEYKNEDWLLDQQIWQMNGINSVQYKLTNHQRLGPHAVNITVEL
jgi:hypothetical protein